MKQNSKFPMNCVSVNVNWMEMYVIQSKNGIMMNVDSSSWRDGYMWNPRTCNYEWIKACKIDEYLDTKNWLCKKRLGKLLLACEDVIINTTETSLVNKKVTCKNSKCLIPCHW